MKVLDPKDLLVTPASLGFVTDVGSPRALQVTLLNGGIDDPSPVTPVAVLPDPSMRLTSHTLVELSFGLDP